MREGISQGRRPELVGGGLIRSLGGWAEVLSLRRRGMEASSDQRILGSSEFVENLLSEVGKRERETLRLSVRVRELGSLIKEIAEGGGAYGDRICDLGGGRGRYRGGGVCFVRWRWGRWDIRERRWRGFWG